MGGGGGGGGGGGRGGDAVPCGVSIPDENEDSPPPMLLLPAPLRLPPMPKDISSVSSKTSSAPSQRAAFKWLLLRSRTPLPLLQPLIPLRSILDPPYPP